MTTEQRKRKKFFTTIKSKYRLVILNDINFKETFSIRLSLANIYALTSIVFIILIGLIFFLVVVTPLKEYIPGYGDTNMRKDLVKLKTRSDSLALVVTQQEAWINNIRNILNGNVDTVTNLNEKTLSRYDTVQLDKLPDEDIALREQIESEESYALNEDPAKKNSIVNLNLFPPVKGYITQKFDPNKDHYGIDIVANANESIKAALDGTVIMADWTVATGYVIAIQHQNNLITFYKHNSVLLKKVGNFVKAGDAIAIIGNSGEMSTGPHLHFELWKDGVPVDPELYMVF